MAKSGPEIQDDLRRDKELVLRLTEVNRQIVEGERAQLEP